MEHGRFELAGTPQKRRPPIIVTDCMRLYDRLSSPSSPTSTSIEALMLSPLGKTALIRCAPTNRMLANGLTEDSDPIDLLRACIKGASNQIFHEETSGAKPNMFDIRRSPFAKTVLVTGLPSCRASVEKSAFVTGCCGAPASSQR